MSDFQVLVQPIFIKEHPNADALELGNIGHRDGWQVVVRKGQFKTGDLVAYIGENSVVPEWVLKQYGFWNEEAGKGLLAGTKGDRVKGVKLRGEFSLGICIPVKEVSLGWDDEEKVVRTAYELQDTYVSEGEDVTELLGVTKYEPPIPVHMAGQVFNAGTSVGVNYDIEDIKNFPNVFVEGEEVQMTAKLHGTNCQIVVLTQEGAHTYLNMGHQLTDWIVVETSAGVGYVTVASKGQGAQGLFFKNNEANAGNLYLNATRQYWETIVDAAILHGHECMSIVGEVFGGSVQDGFNYGLKTPELRIFDVYSGFRGQGGYADDDGLDGYCNTTGVPRVPVLYRGPFSYAKLDELANAPEDGLPGVKHIREGVIVKPVEERRDPKLGRVALKHRSIAYMSRKGGTEYS